MLYRESGEAPYLSNARHAVDFVRDAFPIRRPAVMPG